MSLTITSGDFATGQGIPQQYTCEGPDLSPDLSIANAPTGTQSLALVVEDPDAPDPEAPKRTWVHWILYNLPPDMRELPAGITEANLPNGAALGLNDWGRVAYGGPCPPIGKHRYFFRVYALDKKLDGLGSPTRAQLNKAMRGHVLEEAALMGRYEKHHQ